jgi:hypothetical protein
MMKPKELVQIYKSLFDTWRFQVNSHWQRSSYFAAFETVAIGACWKVLTDGYRSTGIMLSGLGIALTIVWFLNNRKTHFYAHYWFQAVGDVETKLMERTGEHGIDFAGRLLNRPRVDLLRHPNLVQAVPAIFSIAWFGLLSFGVRSMLQPVHMNSAGTFEAVSLAIAIASLLVSTGSVLIAKNSLLQAKQVADREQREWNERKWVDMYLKANEIYDYLDRFRVLSDSWSQEEWQHEWNTLMHRIRQAHALAVVFPINPAIDAFVNATAVFKDRKAISEEDLSKTFNAVELIRDKAKIGSPVLGVQHN